MNLKRPQLIEYINRSLGAPFWVVQLSKEQVEDAIADALATYGRWKPRKVRQAIAAHDGITIVDPQHGLVDATINGLLDVNIITTAATQNPDIEAQMLSGKFAFYGVRSPLYDIRFYEYQREWIEFAGKRLSSSPDYAFRLLEDGTPQFWIYAPGGLVYMDVEFAAPHKDLDTIPSYDEIKIKKLALAQAKILLGRIRSRYDTVPVANKDLKQDGDKLLEEGKTEWEAEVAALQASVVDQIGVYF